MRFLLFVLIAPLVFASVVAAEQQTDRAYKDFSQLPFVTNVQLSPDGKSLAYLMNKQSRTVLVSVDLESGKPHGIVQTDNEKYKIRWIKWANNEHIVFSALYPDRRYMAGTQETRLMVANKHRENFDPLIMPRRQSIGLTEHPAQFQDNVIDWLPDDPEHILVSVDFDEPVLPSVYKVNLYERSRSRVHRPRGYVMDWATDQQGRVRIGNAYDRKEGISSTHILDIEEDKWHVMWAHEALIDPPYQPLGFGLNPHILYLRADHNGKGAIYTVDTRHLDQPPELKSSDPDYDIQGGLIYSPKTNDAIGVYHSQAEGSRIYWDAHYQALEAGINKALPETDNQLVSFSQDEQRYILYTTSDTSPGIYYVGDRETKSLTRLLSTYPQLESYTLSPKQLIKLEMRDGLIIEAYLTLPHNRKKGEKLPAVIFPHGGPISRDYGNFDYWTQYFAAKGIAVLQPNFRGSSGYGHDFLLQAVANYGQGMQDDLVDSTHWLIEQGIADPQRICIAGASYGGYAALTASFKTPELYQCAISFAGISDLKAQRNQHRYFVNREVAKKQYGEDSGMLEQNSAYYNVESIDIPILLVHGDKDRVVLPVQSSKLVSRLEDADKVFSYMELENGSHYLLKQKNRTSLFAAMDEFLTRYLRLKH